MAAANDPVGASAFVPGAMSFEGLLLPETYLLKRVHGSNASLTAPNSSGQLLRAMRASVERKRTREAGA